MTIISVVTISLGVLFMAISALGLVNLPGLYTRAHAVAKSETFALMLILVGLLFHPDITIGGAIRLVLILLFSMAANPTAVHALLRAAYRSGVQPWKMTDGADTARAADAAPTTPEDHT